MSKETKYHRMHYNFVAKRLRNHYPMGGGSISDSDVIAKMAERRVIEDIALEFAKKFKEDDPENFDPMQFLDQCSPDSYYYPLSELWDKEEASVGT